MRRAQTTTETLLLISVLCVAIVGVAWLFSADFIGGMRNMSEGAGEAYVDPSRAP
ncbi:MAG TPA: hypothetical protein QGF58_21155 [Myxococcota bacterium]|nr:hypothetical protein [Myxococcota bacterium]